MGGVWLSMYVAVVEDDPNILFVVRDVLAMEGVESIGFNRPFNPEDLTLQPDLFLVDLMLPGTSGIDLARDLRHRGYAVTPMIAMSASGSMIERASESGLF